MNSEAIKLELEIGTGRAHFLFARAKQVPERHIVGIEYKARWINQAVKKQIRENITNVTPLHGDAWEIVPRLFKPESLSMIHLHFPDPWWKRRHHKRRILNHPYLDLLFSLMKPGAQFFFQTDVKEIWDLYIELLETKLANPLGSKVSAKENPLGAQTHREKKCEENGLPIYRALLIKN